MKNVKNKLRVYHIPQVPMDAFYIPVVNEEQAALIMFALSIQHLWLEKNNVIPDYSNAMGVEMLGEDGEWEDYWNDDEGMEWDEVEDTYFSTIGDEIHNENK